MSALRVPRFLALDIFARLPADARLLLALVSPSWRALVAEPSLWACVDLSEASGVTRASDALLLACSAKARGGMRSLDVCGRVWAANERTPEKLRPPISETALLTTLQNNAHSLQHLRALWLPLDAVKYTHGECTLVPDNLLRAAPGLTLVEVDSTVAAFDSSLLRNGVVSVRRLRVLHAPASFSAFLADARQCFSLSEVELHGIVHAPQIEELIHFAYNKPLTALGVETITTAALPSLTRLLCGGRLTALDVSSCDVDQALLTPSAEFCAAVAAAPLSRLRFWMSELFVDLDAGLSLVNAVTGHPTLCHLCLACNPVAPAGRHAVGAALGLLVAADSPLITLDVSTCELGDDGLLPLIDALPHNTHLRRLDCEQSDFTQLSAARLLAAVRANVSLIELDAAWEGGHNHVPFPELVEAEAVVAARAGEH